MPHLSRRDTQLLLSLLRERSRSPATPPAMNDHEEERLLRRLEQRMEESVEAVREWRADVGRRLRTSRTKL